MKERLKRIFGVFGGFFRAIGRTLGRAGGWFKDNAAIVVGVTVSILLVALIVGVGIGMLHFMRSSDFYSGRVTELTFRYVEQKKELDTAAVENVQLKYERDGYKEAATQLEAYAQQLQQTTMPIGQVFWCTNMPTELIAKDKQSLVLATADFVAKLTDVDVAPAGVCVDIVGITGSEVRGEMYVPAQRVFSSGAADPLLVYWQVIPGEEGKAQIIGYYSWITREWHPVGP